MKKNNKTTKDLNPTKMMDAAEKAKKDQETREKSRKAANAAIKEANESRIRTKVYPTKEEIRAKFEAKKAEMQKNLDAQADRIIDKMIKDEERQKRLDEAEKIAKEKAKVTVLKKKEAKEARRMQLAKSIPSKEAVEDAKKRQAELSKQYEKKLDEKYDAEEQKKAFEAKRNKRKELMAKRRDAFHKKRKGEKIIAAPKPETIEQHKKTPEEIRADFLKYQKERKEMFEKSGVQPGSKAAEKQKVKREVYVKAHPQAVAEKRLTRLEAKQTEEFRVKANIAKQLAHFKEVQEKRNKKREEKRAKYLTKGGKEVPKVKNKVKARPYTITPPKQKETVKYIVVTQFKNREDGVGAFVCYPENVSKRIKEAHEKHMRHPKLGDPENYIGMFVKDPNNPENYIFEMINENFDRNQYSRMKKAKAA